MASHVIALLAASGLLASGAAPVSNTRSADALPQAKVALVKVAAGRQAGCFSPINGKSLKITKSAKMKCNNFAQAGSAGAVGAGASGSAGIAAGTVVSVVSVAAAGSALGLSVSSATGASGG